MMATVKFVSYAFLLWNFYWIFCQCLSSENRCLGGPSLRGLVDMPKSRDEVSCCDDYGCYGYRVDFVEHLVNNSFQLPAKARLKRYSVQRKEKRFARKIRSPEVEKINDVTGVSTSCCSTNVSILFPISGISATRMERVTVLQTPSLRQPVVYQLCNEEPCKLLRGNCSQVYTPQIFYIVSSSNTSSPPVIVQDHVFVESGCTCTTSLRKNFSKISQSIAVDPAIAEVIELLTRRPSTYTPKLSNDKPDKQNLPLPVPVPTPELRPSASIELLTNSPPANAPGSNNAVTNLTGTQNLTSPVPVSVTTPELPSSASVELLTSSPSTSLPGLNNDISSLTEKQNLTSPVSAPELLPSASIELPTSSPSISTPEFKNNINSLTDEENLTSPVPIPVSVPAPGLPTSASVELLVSSPPTSAPEFNNESSSLTDEQTSPVSVSAPTPSVPQPEILPSARMLNLPLMSNLPLPGYPVSIPEGLFHPVLLLMETYSIHQNTTHTT